MSLTQALGTALSGLQVNQASIAMVAANVANADTPGYTRKVVNQVATGGNVRASASASATSSAKSTYTSSGNCVSRIPARPMPIPAPRCTRNCRTSTASPVPTLRWRRSTTAFTSALQVLSTSPDDPGARTAVINSAQLLTQQLNQMSGSIQSLRAQRRTWDRRRGQQSQRGDDPDRLAQRANCCRDSRRRRDRGAAGSARLLYRSIVAVDGYQRRSRATQSGQHFHQQSGRSLSARRRLS